MESGKYQKNFYRLWWEFLNRSDDYRAFCDGFRETLKNREPIPEKYRKTADGKCVHPFVRYGYSDPAFALIDAKGIPFDEWWEHHKKVAADNKKNMNAQIVSDYYDYVRIDIQGVLDYFKKVAEREPTIEEFVASFFDPLAMVAEKKMVVDAHYGTTEEIMSGVQRYLKNFEKKAIERSRLEEIARYGKVYDLWKKKCRWRDIIIELGNKSQKKDPDNANVKRAFQLDCAKAKKIIKSVEHHVFPGEYYVKNKK